METDSWGCISVNGLEDFVKIDGIVKYGDMIPSGIFLSWFHSGGAHWERDLLLDGWMVLL